MLLNVEENEEKKTKKKKKYYQNYRFAIELCANKITNKVHVHHRTILFRKDCIRCQYFAIFSGIKRGRTKKGELFPI